MKSAIGNIESIAKRDLFNFFGISEEEEEKLLRQQQDRQRRISLFGDDEKMRNPSNENLLLTRLEVK